MAMKRHMKKPRLKLHTAAGLLLLLFSTLFAASPVAPVNRSSDGLALRGYDAVAYFTDGRAVKGTMQFLYEWMGVKWQFADKEHREMFSQDPQKYAPQFGGYCSWAVGHNYTADGDPEAWRIVDGKLYLNYDRSVQKKWEQDRAKWIQEANRNWPGLHK
jgi:YHS domain-containing protein